MSDELASSTSKDDKNLRHRLEAALSNGLNTQVEPRAYEHDDILRIVSELQSLNKTDYDDKLILAGFTLDAYNPGDDPDDNQACETCMYYLVHRQFCELPELMLPVKENWSCRLWRI
ncbi:MAG: hypothetical protein COB62_05560 [Piscirickettsiaceae bacterium]|nr:MAG: hypothetical protein COB62_05560 [Piscirickettsiaceae bacterium]